MSADEPEQKSEESNRSERGTGYHIHVPDTSAPIKDALEKLSAAYVRDQQENRTHNSQVLWWNKATFWAVFAYTAATFCLLILSYCNLREIQSSSAQFDEAIRATNRLADAAKRSGNIADSALQSSREALERSQRAWIGPVDAEMGPDDITLAARPAKIRFRVIYQNTGREPALDVTVNAIGGAVPVPPGFSDWDHLEIPENKMCEGLSPTRGNIAVYPSTTSSPNNDIRFTGTVKDGENAVNELTDGNQILWINGCIAYMTIKTPHQSAFCFYLLPDLTKPFAKWRFNGCRTGNWAD